VNEDVPDQQKNRIVKELLILLQANVLLINTENNVAVSFHTEQSKRFLKPQITFNDMGIKYKYEVKLLVLHVTENIK
jgi:hypothetical protein